MQWFQTAGISEINPKSELPDFNIVLGSKIVLDNTGNIYVAGSMDRIARFGTITKTFDDKLPKVFIAKYNNKGQAQWVETIPTKAHAMLGGLTIDKSGSIYITGNLADTLNTIDADRSIKTAKGNLDNFVAKYNTDGQLQWVESVREKTNDWILPKDVVADQAGNIYITGAVRPRIPTRFPYPNKPFTAKYNSDGELQWLKSTEETESGYGSRILVDDSNNIYVMGGYSDSIKFGNIKLIAHKNARVGYFLTKYNTQGTPLWVKSLYGKSSFSTEDIAIDTQNNVYIGGYFEKEMKIDKTLGTSTGRINLFISKVNRDGVVQWLRTTKGSLGTVSRSIAVGANNEVYTTGYFIQKAVFDSQYEFTAGAYEQYVFTWRFHQ